MSISTAADIILSGINCIQETICWFYRVSLLLGYCILLIVLRIYEAIRVLIYCFCEVVKILNDDFDIFLSDIGGMLMSVWIYISEAFNKSITTVIHMNREATSIFGNIFSALGSLFENDTYQYIFLNCIQRPFELVFEALCLIGFTASHIVDGFWACIGNIPKFPQLVFSFLKKRTVHLGYCALYVLTHEAMYGFLIVSGLIYFSYKSKLCHRVSSSCQKTFLSICFIVFNYVRTFITLVCISLLRIKMAIKRSSIDNTLFIRDDLQKQLEREKAEKLCIVCMDRKRNAMLLNCKHLVLCNDCAYAILDYQEMCPVCRSYVSEVIPVYT